MYDIEHLLPVFLYKDMFLKKELLQNFRVEVSLLALISNEQLQEDEMKILSELQNNSKESIDIIAKRIGFSRQKVWRIIKQLEAKKMIWGYTAVIDEQKIGQKYFIYMAKRTSKKVNEDIIDEIVSRKFEKIVNELGIMIESSYFIHGEYDWVITFYANDIKMAKKLAEKFSEIHPGYIEKATIMQSLMFIKKQFMLNPEKTKIKDVL
ncbi:MAG: Lrp/AsnC family transcriptional regulator [Candidatus Thermoplasmatota archaeon]|nr:Lrp/AsnC family transcriptional regulator [Candidatus Thermoplasmatota archaeon]